MVELKVRLKDKYGGGFVTIRAMGHFNDEAVRRMLHIRSKKEPKSTVRVNMDGVEMDMPLDNLEL